MNTTSHANAALATITKKLGLTVGKRLEGDLCRGVNPPGRIDFIFRCSLQNRVTQNGVKHKNYYNDMCHKAVPVKEQ